MGVPVIKLVAVVALLAGLCACGGGPSAPPSTGTPVAVPSDVAASASAAAAISSADASDTGPKVGLAPDGSAAVSIPDQLCVFLDQERIKIDGLDSTAAIDGLVSDDFRAWTAQDPNRKFKNALEPDAITRVQCPKVRTRILAAAEASSLVPILGHSWS
jgi:hypothetical protein